MDIELKNAIKANNAISAAEKKIRGGKGTLKDSRNLASQVGKEAAKIVERRLKEAYPSGQIPEAEVRRILSPILKDNHAFIAEMTAMVIDEMYREAEIGMKAVRSEYDKNHENEMVTEISRRSFEDGFTW